MSAFEERQDLKKYGDNALLLFALELRFNISDIFSVATQSLTDGNDDKKCDLVYIDTENKHAVIAQGYVAQPGKKSPPKSAPANKATDLNGAVSWLLSMDIDLLPERIKPAAIEIRGAIENDLIDMLEIWYVHNCPESKNVKAELTSASTSAKHTLNSKYAKSSIEVRYNEVGLESLEDWYRASTISILVDDEFKIQVPGGYRLETDDWDAFSTAIPAIWLHGIFKKYKTQLLSANVRDYLGSRQSDKNINYGIEQTAAAKPKHFWAFNNGITALVNHFEFDEQTLTIKGISIVNGAQTTGAIGNLSNPPDSTAYVPARFIKCKDRKIVKDIIRYNNSQNKISPADFRSSDKIQDRLRKEFKKEYPSLTYLGARRGGEDDIIKRPINLVPSDTVAQSLAAFHQKPVTAYNQKGMLWDSDAEYAKIFHHDTHADHIFFVYSLFRAISNFKLELTNKDEAICTNKDMEILSFLRYRGSIFLLIAAIGYCMESVLDERIPSAFALKFANIKNLEQGEKVWRPIVELAVAFRKTLQKPLEKGLGLKNEREVDEAIKEFASFFEATATSNKPIYKQFSNNVSVLHRND